MFVVANWGRLEMLGGGRTDAYVIGWLWGSEKKWGRETKGVRHINKDLTNIMIMFEHSPELILADSGSPK